eukprot:scaffold892_cov291-Pavlova_lutheri.AAC.2
MEHAAKTGGRVDTAWVNEIQRLHRVIGFTVYQIYLYERGEFPPGSHRTPTGVPPGSQGVGI